MQVADVPDRHESGSGELNYRSIFAAIKRAGVWWLCGAGVPAHRRSWQGGEGTIGCGHGRCPVSLVPRVLPPYSSICSIPLIVSLPP